MNPQSLREVEDHFIRFWPGSAKFAPVTLEGEGVRYLVLCVMYQPLTELELGTFAFPQLFRETAEIPTFIAGYVERFRAYHEAQPQPLIRHVQLSHNRCSDTGGTAPVVTAKRTTDWKLVRVMEFCATAVVQEVS